MDNVFYSQDSAGFWLWRTAQLFSDRTFASEGEAIENYLGWRDVYAADELVS